ncbi:hypothetical protein F4803DRAFT_546648 [Xylaria telfairii]|nr:hypothetical protein F4803DRAFT_546648 [Xylaria telfairii]
MDEDEEQSIASRTRIAEGRFGALTALIELGSESSSVSIEAATDALDKFKLWAGNIGARQPPTSPASLEARLVTAQRILKQVGDLLDDIILALDDLLEITSGSRENRQITHGNLVDDNDPTSLEHQLEGEISHSLERNESQDVLDVISDGIRSLLKISVLIRKATPRDRFARALHADNPFIDQFDINYVAERYLKLNRPDYRWLCVRLGRAITKRRQFLHYSREHGGRIAGSFGNYRQGNKPYVLVKDSRNAKAFDTSLNTQMRSSAETKLSGSLAAYTYTSTKASTLDIKIFQRLGEEETNEEDSRSFISAGSSSLQVEDENSRLRLPTLEESSGGNSFFECPFCLGIQTFTQESTWRRHAYRDLKAYVCTLGEGKCDSEMFGDSRIWFDHELQCHRRQWVCVVCSKGPFRTPAAFKSHMRDMHTDVLVDDRQLEVFMAAGQHAVDAIAADECPFCDEWGETLKNNTPMPESTGLSEVVITVDPVQFRRHVASHMEQLALFAIPRSMGDDGSEEDSDGAARSRCTAKYSNTDNVWIPDPPLHIAAASGDLATFRVLLQEGADIDSRGETWGTVLDAALSCQHSTRDDILSHLRNHYEDWESSDMLRRIELPVDQLTTTQLPPYLDAKTESQNNADDSHSDLSSTGATQSYTLPLVRETDGSQRIFYPGRRYDNNDEPHPPYNAGRYGNARRI